MKKNFFIAVLALGTLASCTSDEFVGENGPNALQSNSDAIGFGSGFRAVTRADHTGKNAATLLNNQFIVSGFKGDGSAMTSVFPDYVVKYTENTAGKTESNTSDWEYVGITALAPSAIAGNTQTIKYWDYATSRYDFVAYSTGDATVITTGTPTDGQVLVSAIAPNSYGPTYTLKGASADLAKCYIADMVTAYRDGTTDPNHPYQKEVTLSFRNLAAKARVALYETIPGYSVKDVKFYTSHSQTINTASADEPTLFTTGTSDADNFFTAGTATVSFPTAGSAKVSESDYNKAHVAFSDMTKSTTQAFGTLQKVAKESNEAGDDNVFLGRTLPTASYAGTSSPWYTTVLPNETGTVLELRVDYTLVPTDGAAETIKVHGATAFIPAIYAAWKPNYAYTYIFKLSDNTNGWTDPAGTDPAGLYPITFDAVVVDAEEFTQSTITTVATPSITTYQKGHDVTKDEYAVGDIYVQVMDNSASPAALKSDLGTKATLYTMSAVKSEAEVMDALNIRTSTTGSTLKTIVGRNGQTLTGVALTTDVTAVPGVDGNDITVTSGTAAKFAATTGTYAFVYEVSDAADSYIYAAETLSSEPTNWPTNWYKDPNGAEAASSTFETGTYYHRYTNDNKVYGVKVIKVQ